MPLAKLGVSTVPSVKVAPPKKQAASLVKKLQIRLQPEAWRRIKSLALDEGASLEQLGLEAFSLLLERRGLPPLDEVPDAR